MHWLKRENNPQCASFGNEDDGYRLYRRIDFLEHQLAQFVLDPEFHHEIDLLYMLDFPELAEHIVPYATGLARLYAIPFQLRRSV